MKKVIVILLCGAVLCTMIYFLYNHKSSEAQIEPEAVKFSQKAWEQFPEKRYMMVDDLLTNYDFSNMTKNDVINLLGSQLLVSEGNALRYETKGGFLQDEVLVFTFDEEGDFVEVGKAN